MIMHHLGHLITHSGENQTNATNVTIHIFVQTLSGVIWKHTAENLKPKKCNLCDFASSRANNLRAHLKTHTGEKSNKCNQCDYASSRAGNLMKHIKIHVVKSQTNAANVIMHPLMQAIWDNIWKCTAEKSQTNAINVTLHLLRQAIWGYIWKHTVEKNQTNAANVTLPALIQVR